MVKALTQEERALVDRMLKDLPVRARTDYLVYRQSGGVVLGTVADIEAGIGLYWKGWLTAEPDYAYPFPVWLTHEAWKRFSLDEWMKIEEQRLDKERGSVSGSW